MMRTLTIKLSYIFLGFLIACTPVTSQVSTPTGQPEVMPTVNPTQTPTAIPTPSPNILELDSASELPLPAYQRECVNILPSNTKTLQDFSATGYAVFSDRVNNSDNDQIVLYDLKSGEKHTIPEDADPHIWTDLPEISPDHKWLFYMMGEESKQVTFVLSNSAGETVKTFPGSIFRYSVSGYDYLYVYEWLGSDSLRLLSKDYQGENLGVFLLDPFTEQITRLQNDFDGLQAPVVKYARTYRENHEYLDWGVDPFFDVIIFLLNGANVAYSPDKNLAFYPHQDGYAVLYDMRNQKELAHVVIPNWGELPKWSPKGEYISVIATPPNTSQDAAKKDFYLLSSDGKIIKRLTYLSEQFDRVSIKEYSWSPDGTKIAFWLNTDFPLAEDEIVPYELAIVDVTNGNIANHCFSYHSDKVKELAGHAGLLIEPVWSPGGNQLLIPGRTPAKTPGPYHSYDVRTILLDPSKLSAVEIMESVLIHGWMTND